MLNLLLNQLFLLLTKVHLVHFNHQLVPSFLLLDFFVFLPRIFRLNIGLDTLCTFPRTIGWLDLLTGLRDGLLLSSRCLLLRLLLLRLAGMLLLNPIKELKARRWR